MPSDAPEKWELFKKYNKRDVEVEMSIQHKLSRFPVPDSVWDEYHIDQEINDRGIMLDMDVVKNAIRFDAFSKARLIGTLKDKTELENPTPQSAEPSSLTSGRSLSVLRTIKIEPQAFTRVNSHHASDSIFALLIANTQICIPFPKWF